MSIPVVDLSQFLSENTKATFVQQLGKAFGETGFVAVKNHGIPEELTSALYTHVNSFFNLSSSVKKKYEIPELAGQRGFTSFGKEHAKGFEAPDLKEFFQFGQEVTDGDSIKEEYPQNITVSEVPDFTPTLFKVFKSFEKTGDILLKAIALYLGLPENYFYEHTHNGNSILRAIYYPPITEEPKSAIRAEQHEDCLCKMS